MVKVTLVAVEGIVSVFAVILFREISADVLYSSSSLKVIFEVEMSFPIITNFVAFILLVVVPVAVPSRERSFPAIPICTSEYFRGVVPSPIDVNEIFVLSSVRVSVSFVVGIILPVAIESALRIRFPVVEIGPVEIDVASRVRFPVV